MAKLLSNTSLFGSEPGLDGESSRARRLESVEGVEVAAVGTCSIPESFVSLLQNLALSLV